MSTKLVPKQITAEAVAVAADVADVAVAVVVAAVDAVDAVVPVVAVMVAAAADADTENYLRTFAPAFAGVNLSPRKRGAGTGAPKLLGLNLYD